ncbi:MAG TPA: hypothetical protein VN756_13305 [Solirubrobacterales bacterium]|nr:hypothetical protein [Solirubrobacterales bacterium]
MTLAEQLAALIAPHLDVIEADRKIIFPIPCEEGTNVCWRQGQDPRGGMIQRDEDFVFLLDADEIAQGRLRFIPSHRECAESEWGREHIIPRLPLRHFEVETEAGTRTWQAESFDHAREQHEDAHPEEEIQTITVVNDDGSTDTLLPARSTE